MSSSNQNVGRDELAAILGASYASDLIVAAGTSASDLAKKSGGVGGAVVGRRKHYIKGGGGGGGIDEEDVSKMDRAQAAALVARKFAAAGAGSGALAAGAMAMRHRASGKRKRMLQHHLLVEDYTILENRGADDDDVMKSQHVKEEDLGLEKEMNDDHEEEEESRFAIRPADGMRKKSEAKVLVRRAGDESKNRRRRSSSSSESVSSSSSESVSSPVSSSSHQRSHSTRHGRRRRRRKRGGEPGHGKNNDGGRTRSNSLSSSSSSSSSEDQADIRRRKAREKCAQKNQDEGGTSTAVSSIRHDANGEQQDFATEVEQNHSTCERYKDDATAAVSRNDKSSPQFGEREQTMDDRSSTNRNNGHNCSPRSKRRSTSSSVKSTTDSSSSSTSEESSSSSSSSSSSDESDHKATLPIPISKPLFVPKFKRGTVAELEARNQKHEEFEKQRAQEAEKRAIQSRALVAAAAAMSSAGKANSIGEGDEFDTGEVGGEFIPVPDDTDPNEVDSPELVAAERNAWEVRELIRILRDVDDALERERERRELERRRALTDEERVEEDRLSGKYRAPGEARRVNGGVGSKGGGKQQQEESSIRYLQRFHHRGAFYMDEDTLNQAGEDDVRHRAADYSRAATGEDKIDKSALPKVMQVKKFGFAGYSTKYKGLSKEDTTDKKMDFLPIRGHAAAGRRSSRH